MGMFCWIRNKNSTYVYTVSRGFNQEEKLPLPLTKVVFLFDKQDYLEKYRDNNLIQKLNPYFVELYDYFRTRKTEEDKIEEFFEFLSRKGFIGELSFREFAMVSNIMGWLYKEEGDKFLGMTENLYKLSDRAFYGGRAEVLHRKAKGLIGYYDVKSAYGFNLTLPLPKRDRIKRYKKLSLDDVKELNKEGYYGILRIKAHEERKRLPRLPVRVRIGDEIQNYYPTGTIEGFYSSYEVSLFEKEEIKIYRGFFFKRERSEVLNEAIERLMELKENSDNEGIRAIAKGSIVRLYGMIAKKNQLRYSRLIGSFITAFQRYRLYKALELADKLGKVLYVDTDGFLVLFKNEESMRKMDKALKLGNKIGRWTKKGVFHTYHSFGVKRYIAVGEDGLEIKISGEPIYELESIDHDYEGDKLKITRRGAWTNSRISVELEGDTSLLPKRREDGTAWSIEELKRLELESEEQESRFLKPLYRLS